MRFSASVDRRAGGAEFACGERPGWFGNPVVALSIRVDIAGECDLLFGVHVGRRSASQNVETAGF